MRVWIDITNSPHVLFFEPIIADLCAGGHEVFVTARDYAQTVPLLEQRHIEHRLIGHHRGAATGAKALGLLSRSSKLIGYGWNKHFDVAFSHNSNDLSVAAWALGVPHLIVHDYEHANLSYAVNARLATRILVPEAIPTQAIVAHGTTAWRVGHFPGLRSTCTCSRTLPPRTCANPSGQARTACSWSSARQRRCRLPPVRE